MRYTVRIDDVEKTVDVSRENGRFSITVDGRSLSIDCEQFGDSGYMSLLIDNKSYLIESSPVNVSDGRYYVGVMGRHYDVEVLDELLVAARAAHRADDHRGPHTVFAPMPGLIVSVNVKQGDTVRVGDPVVIMEAMKMQNELTADVSGVVTSVHIAPQDTVDSQAPLVVIEQE